MENDAKAVAKRAGLYWILWWKTDPEELRQGLEDYDSPQLFKRTRFLAAALLWLSMAISVALILGLHGNVQGLADVAVSGVLSVFILRAQRWAMIVAMIFWTLEKAFLLGGAPYLIVPQIVWWCVYMHVFMLALKVENARRKPKAAPEVSAPE